MELSPVTSGPIVNECLETSIPGVFACGNVLHVHDLVDFVSREAESAGKHAAAYAAACNGLKTNSKLTQGAAGDIPITTGFGVRYTVPSTLNPRRMEEIHTIRFRVGDVYQNCYISVYLDDVRVIHRKRPILTPGEMEEASLKRQELEAFERISEIIVKIEEG